MSGLVTVYTKGQIRAMTSSGVELMCDGVSDKEF